MRIAISKNFLLRFFEIYQKKILKNYSIMTIFLLSNLKINSFISSLLVFERSLNCNDSFLYKSFKCMPLSLGIRSHISTPMPLIM